MKKLQNLGADLQVVRQLTGLRQLDCAHLMGTAESRVSKIETGVQRPYASEIATLSIIYGKPMESLLAGVLDANVEHLILRLRTMPSVSPTYRDRDHRTEALRDLALRLEVLTTKTP